MTHLPDIPMTQPERRSSGFVPAANLYEIRRRGPAVRRWLLAFEAGCSANYPEIPAKTVTVSRERRAAERLVERGAISPLMHRLHEVHRDSEARDEAWRWLEQDDRLCKENGAIGPMQLYEILSNYTESEKLAYRQDTARRQRSIKRTVNRLRARFARKMEEDRQGMLAFGECSGI
jgi:hypothetical protein